MAAQILKNKEVKEDKENIENPESTVGFFKGLFIAVGAITGLVTGLLRLHRYLQPNTKTRGKEVFFSFIPIFGFPLMLLYYRLKVGKIDKFNAEVLARLFFLGRRATAEWVKKDGHKFPEKEHTPHKKRALNALQAFISALAGVLAALAALALITSLSGVVLELAAAGICFGVGLSVFGVMAAIREYAFDKHYNPNEYRLAQIISSLTAAAMLTTIAFLTGFKIISLPTVLEGLSLTIFGFGLTASTIFPILLIIPICYIGYILYQSSRNEASDAYSTNVSVAVPENSYWDDVAGDGLSRSGSKSQLSQDGNRSRAEAVVQAALAPGGRKSGLGDGVKLYSRHEFRGATISAEASRGESQFLGEGDRSHVEAVAPVPASASGGSNKLGVLARFARVFSKPTHDIAGSEVRVGAGDHSRVDHSRVDQGSEVSRVQRKTPTLAADDKVNGPRVLDSEQVVDKPGVDDPEVDEVQIGSERIEDKSADHDSDDEADQVKIEDLQEVEVGEDGQAGVLRNGGYTVVNQDDELPRSPSPSS